MPVFQVLEDHDQEFRNLPEAPVIINDLKYIFEKDKNAVQELIYTKFTSDMFSLLPSCDCGERKGVYSVGVICPKCNTKVKSAVLSDIQPLLWFRKPNGVSKLINGMVLTMLRKRFIKSGYDIIQWIMDTTYRSTSPQPAIVAKIVAMGVNRGYNNFVENFDDIMNKLFSLREFKSKTKNDYLYELLLSSRNVLFSDYIPLPNRTMFIVDKTDLGIYVDPNIMKAIDAIEMLISIDKDYHDQNSRVKENRTAKALVKLGDFYEKYERTAVAGHNGVFRKHVFGSRTNFSFRAVISSITDAHSYDEIHVPWGIGLAAFKYHLTNKLQKMGMDINSSEGLINGNIGKYHPLLDRLLEELIEEAPDKALTVIFQRNPSLLPASAQRVRITKFKKDPLDLTIGLSILIVRGYNALLEF